jgi:VanZ family protein
MRSVPSTTTFSKGTFMHRDERSTRGIGNWLAPVLWGVLILSLSTLPEMYFGAPRTPQGRRLHYYLELLVHVVQFSVFFLLVLRALRAELPSRARVLGYAFAAVLLMSLLNESVQTLTPTRMFDVADMAMDALGGLVGLGLARLFDVS